MNMITIAAIGVAAVLLAAQIKTVRSEYALYLSLAAGLFVFFYGIQKMDTVLQVISRIQEGIKVDRLYFVTLMKMIGITYVGEFAAGICKDSGHQFLAGQIEIFGKLSILAISAPIVLALLETLEAFLA